MTLGVVADHTLETASSYSMEVHSEDDMAKVIYRVAAEPGVPVRLTKPGRLPHRRDRPAARA
nr:hypothetical protein [Nocardioides convexus]